MKQFRGRVVSIYADTSNRPEKAVGNFVSDLNVVDRGALVDECGDEIPGIPVLTGVQCKNSRKRRVILTYKSGY